MICLRHLLLTSWCGVGLNSTVLAPAALSTMDADACSAAIDAKVRRSRRSCGICFFGDCAHRWIRCRSFGIRFFGGRTHRWRSCYSSCSLFFVYCARRCPLPPHSRNWSFRRLRGHFLQPAGILRHGSSSTVTRVSADDLSPCLGTELYISCARQLSLTVVMEMRGRRGGWGDVQSESPPRSAGRSQLRPTAPTVADREEAAARRLAARVSDASCGDACRLGTDAPNARSA